MKALTPLRIEQIVWTITLIIVFLVGCFARGQDVARLSPPQPPIPALVKKRTNAPPVPPKMDMMPPLPVSGNAPYYYYGVLEFKRTVYGKETENELYYLGWHPNHEAFLKSHGVGNPRFTRRFRAVIRSTSELPNEPVCIWQRADGAGP